MLPVSLLALGLSFATSASCHLHAPLRARAIIDESGLADSYDYIIVGGGSSGLITASILSDNSSVSVLVLEAVNQEMMLPSVEVSWLHSWWRSGLRF